jgi:very-short-patch-repair endonuclease
MCGEKFRRQHPEKPYFMDFACEDLMLAFELDGGGHPLQTEYDVARDKFLEVAGWKVLRIGNQDVVCELHAVLEMIRLEIEKRRQELAERAAKESLGVK